MTNRTTQKELEGLVSRLNRLTGNAQEPWTQINGKLTANIGNYYLEMAYGGVKLVQVVSDGGGIRNITSGFETKRNCYMQIASYIHGIEDCIRQTAEHDATINKIVGA